MKHFPTASPDEAQLSSNFRKLIRSLYENMFALIICFSTPLCADEKMPNDKKNTLTFAPEFNIIFPIFTGIGANLDFAQKHAFSLNYGLTPETFYETIGSVAASFGDNDAYDDVIESAFNDNNVWRFAYTYYFDKPTKGWNINIAYYRLESEGEADIDTVLAAATGQDFSILVNALELAGRDTSVDMESELDIAEVSAGYAWSLSNNLSLNASAGIAKVINNSIQLKTRLPAFESSPAGSALISDTESDLEEILSDYGISPTLSINLKYYF